MHGKKAYDPRSEIKKSMKWTIAQQMKEQSFLTVQDDPICMEITFYTQIDIKSLKIKGSDLKEDVWDLRKPDVDNLCKLYMDAMKGIVYKDDSLVVRLLAQKIKSSNPRVEIKIYALKVKND